MLQANATLLLLLGWAELVVLLLRSGWGCRKLGDVSSCLPGLGLSLLSRFADDDEIMTHQIKSGTIKGEKKVSGMKQ